MKYYHHLPTNQVHALDPFYQPTPAEEFVQLTPQQVAWWKDKPAITWGKLSTTGNEIIEYPVNFGEPVRNNPPPSQEFFTVLRTGFELAADDVWDAVYELEPIPLADAKELVLAKIAELRWTKETGNLEVHGATVSTTRESQNMITNAITLAALAGVTEVDFKAESGWVNLTIEQLKGIAAMIGQHVQRCYSTERTINTIVQSYSSTQECFDLYQNPSTLWESTYGNI